MISGYLIKVKDQWKYLYRAVNNDGQTIYFLQASKRDAPVALLFFRKAISHHDEPVVVTINKNGASSAVLTTLNTGKPDEESITIRLSRYLNNLVEQVHRNRIRPMLGFKSFRRVPTILAGIELNHMIRKGQYQHPQSEALSPAEQFYLLVA